MTCEMRTRTVREACSKPSRPKQVSQTRHFWIGLHSIMLIASDQKPFFYTANMMIVHRSIRLSDFPRLLNVQGFLYGFTRLTAAIAFPVSKSLPFSGNSLHACLPRWRLFIDCLPQWADKSRDFKSQKQLAGVSNESAYVGLERDRSSN